MSALPPIHATNLATGESLCGVWGSRISEPSLATCEECRTLTQSPIWAPLVENYWGATAVLRERERVHHYLIDTAKDAERQADQALSGRAAARLHARAQALREAAAELFALPLATPRKEAP